MRHFCRTVDDDGDDNYDSGTMVFRPAEAAEADGSEEYDDGTMVRASGGDDDDYKPAFMRHIERKREEAAVRETNFDGLSEVWEGSILFVGVGWGRG